MSSPSERRQELLEVLCRRRHDTYDNLGSLVTCRHRLLVSRRHAKGGLTYSRAGGEQQGGHAA